MSDGTPVVTGCDHAAFGMKTLVRKHLESREIEVADMGTHSEQSVDYVDYGSAVAKAISTGKHARGILLCGTGIGMSIVANRFPGVRATLCNDLFSARMARMHNDSNLLVLGGRVVGPALALEIVDTWLDTPFEGGRHQARLDKIEALSG
ncbi:MAG: ribose 5-phosphate isomerase B [Desulfatibacillaceae bacterium]